MNAEQSAGLFCLGTALFFVFGQFMMEAFWGEALLDTKREVGSYSTSFLWYLYPYSVSHCYSDASCYVVYVILLCALHRHYTCTRTLLDILTPQFPVYVRCWSVKSFMMTLFVKKHFINKFSQPQIDLVCAYGSHSAALAEEKIYFSFVRKSDLGFHYSIILH